MKLKDSKTYLNLASAYMGECAARTRYEFIEYGARNEGYKCLAELIDKIVYNEFNHARMFYTKLQDADEEMIKNIEICRGYPFKEKWNLLENLKLAAEDEKVEVKLYKEFSETAKEEGFLEIAKLFEEIAEIENCHNMRFTEIYNQLKNGTIYKREKPIKWKCSGCGYEPVSTSAPKTCPVCQAKQGSFMLNFDTEE